MAFFLFIDESGQDHHDSPYEVLAGVAIDDKDLWNLIRNAHELELNCFGRRYRGIDNEIKARTFLKRKTFRLAEQLPPIALSDRAALAKRALDNGETVTKMELTALAQAKLDYVARLIELCQRYRLKVFASIIGDERSIPAELIIPEPFFVHSDLTTGIQIVDFVAYILSWNFRVGKMNKAARQELDRYTELIKPMRYRTTRKIGDNEEYTIWSITVV